MELSIVICTHNPRERTFKRVLDGLKAQSLPKTEWELLIVDNHSATDLSASIDLQWHPHGRIVRENEIGLTHARARGFRESAAPLVVLVDDDNLLDSDYLENARRIALKNPCLGAIGGSIIGEFESSPPVWFSQFERDLLGVRPLDSDCWSNLPWLWETTPIGAGLILRKEVCMAYLHLLETDPVRRRLDRRGTSLVSAGDSDITQTACRLGFGVGRFATLKLRHLISKDRTEMAYLKRLAEGIGLSQSLLERLHGQTSQPQGGRLYRVGVRLIENYRLLRLKPEQRKVRTAFRRGRKRGLSMSIDSLLSPG